MTRATKGALIGAFVALQGADLVTTNSALARHVGVEVNPLMAVAQNGLGPAWWLPKVIVTIFCVIIMLRCPAHRAMLLAPWVLLMAFVTISNAMH